LEKMAKLDASSRDLIFEILKKDEPIKTEKKSISNPLAGAVNPFRKRMINYLKKEGE
jgi:hypothetical protein